MNTEALKTRVNLLKRFTKIALGIETQGYDYSASNELFFIEEDMGMLRVLLGENNAMYQKMISLQTTIDLKIADNKDPALFY